MLRSVILVEDDARTRERLAGIISALPGLRLAGAAGTVFEARQQLTAQVPDVLLLDLGLPDGDGMELIFHAIHDGAATRVMVLSVFGKGANVEAAIRAGACAVLLKDASSSQIGRAIEAIFALDPAANAEQFH